MFRAATIRRALMATILAGAGTVLTGRTALASCGDYLAAHSVPDQALLSSDSAPTTGPATVIPDSPLCPCHGPSCRGEDPRPVPTPPPPTFQMQRDNGQLAGPVSVTGEDGFEGRLSEPPVLVSRGFPSLIEHPPRQLRIVVG